MSHAPQSVQPAKLAPFACAEPGRRLYDGEYIEAGTEFLEDERRILFSPAFRQLKGKSQVFVQTPHSAGVFFNRQSHTEMVARIAEEVARRLNLNQSLARLTAFAHDLGHPPFGHEGEDALNAVMSKFGGFCHNAQTVRVLTDPIPGQLNRFGLNLTQASLSAIIKHNGPILPDEAPPSIRRVAARLQIDLNSFASAEGQVAAEADTLAYVTHDFEDGCIHRDPRGPFFEMKKLRELPLLGEALIEVEDRRPDLRGVVLLKEATQTAREVMIADMVEHSQKLLDALNPKSERDIHYASGPVIAFSPAMAEKVFFLKKTFAQRRKKFQSVLDTRARQREIVGEVFRALVRSPDKLPSSWFFCLHPTRQDKQARLIADYIATLTEAQVVKLHSGLAAERPGRQPTAYAFGVPRRQTQAPVIHSA